MIPTYLEVFLIVFTKRKNGYITLGDIDISHLYANAEKAKIARANAIKKLTDAKLITRPHGAKGIYYPTAKGYELFAYLEEYFKER